MAAQLITGLNGDYRQARLQPYVDALESRFGPRDQAHKISAASLLPDSVKRFLAARLLASRWFARHLVLDRWFFHADQAPLRV
jgi:hypothetical protein